MAKFLLPVRKRITQTFKMQTATCRSGFLIYLRNQRTDSQIINPEERAMDDKNHLQLLPPFPWKHVLITALVVLAVVGLILIIRRGAGPGVAAALPAVALSVARASRTTHKTQTKEPIDMEFLKAQLREGAKEGAIGTPTELRIVLNKHFEEHGMPSPFVSERQLARVLSRLGLHSKVRSMPGRSERRWYDLSEYGAQDAQ
jgi:hypothetical protein